MDPPSQETHASSALKVAPLAQVLSFSAYSEAFATYLYITLLKTLCYIFPSLAPSSGRQPHIYLNPYSCKSHKQATAIVS